MQNTDYNKGLDKSISWFGDSLTAGAGALTPFKNATGYLEQSLGNRLVNNYGIGGQTMEQIACRHGSKPLYITLSGNTLSGNAPAVITNISTQLLSTTADTTVRKLSGVVNGIRCMLVRTVISSVETYTIRAGNNVSTGIPENSIFYPDTIENSKHDIQIYWWGKNNATSALTGLIDLYNNAISIVSEPKRFVVLGVLPSSDQIIGTTNYNNIISANDLLKNTFPNNYVDINPPTVEEMDFIKYVPTSQDNIDIANGIFPTGMHYDNVHLNGYGYNIIANRVAKMIQLYGW